MAVGLVLLLIAGCAQPESANLRFGLSSNPGTLDARYATDASSSRINRLICRSLVDFDKHLQPVPALASWEQITPRHYRFTLGDESRLFHDNRPLTALDVKATYDSILDPVTASPRRSALAIIVRIRVRDADVVDFPLSRADPLFPGRLVMGILPAHLMASGHPFHRQPVGNGPFEFVSRPNEDRLVTKRQADGQVVEFLRVADPIVRVLKLLRGERDLIQGDLPPELVAWLGERSDVRTYLGQGSNFTYIGFNLNDPVVGQLAVRQAIAHAIDRRAIVRHVMGGAARPANALLVPDHWAGNPALAGYDFHRGRARALLSGLGYDGDERLKIVYKTSSDPFRVRLATVVQHQLKQTEIDIKIRSDDWGTFYGDIKTGRSQMYSTALPG